MSVHQAVLLPSISRRNPERDFEIVKQIGSGTYGEVYKAKLVKTNQMCALKIIKIEPGEDFNIIQQEIAILQDCKHSNIVGYLGSYLSEGWDPVLEEVRKDRLWIAMEFCGGGSLQDIYNIQNSGLNEHQIAFVSREILQGLAYLHERSKLHREIKAASILLTDDGEVKLAGFGIATQLTQTLVKGKPFIGTPYWMAPEVAAVEKKDGYDQKCDIWAVGITAIELAEMQPPMFDLHPTRALQLMTKRNFKSPGLTHKKKWSHNFHDFLTRALRKEPRKRPTAHDILKHEFVDRGALHPILMVPLIRVLEVQPHSTGVQKMNLPHSPQTDVSQEPLPAWVQSVAGEPYHKPRIQRLSPEAAQQFAGEPEYQNVRDMYTPETAISLSSQSRPLPPSPVDAPPLPPRVGTPQGPCANTSQPKSQQEPELDEMQHTYGNVGHQPPPVPRRKQERKTELVYVYNPPPPIPPRMRTEQVSSRQRRQEPEKKAYFSKIFNGCPLKLLCAGSWIHPVSQSQYVLLGAEEGLFSLMITSQGDPVMEQVSPRACKWMRVVENVLVWLSSTNHIISMTNLILLFRSDTQKATEPKRRSHTSKISDSRGCIRCCIIRDPFTEQRFLLAAVPRGILVMKWYQPRHVFLHEKLFECSVPVNLRTFEAFIFEREEYPFLCFGVMEGQMGSVVFNTINLNSTSNWYNDGYMYENRELDILSLQQLEKDTIFVATENSARFVDRTGTLKPSSIQAAQIFFEHKMEAMVFLQNCVLSFHRHGMQGKSLQTQQVTAEVADGSKVFRLLGSHGTIIIETGPADDPASPTNIYILVSEEPACQEINLAHPPQTELPQEPLRLSSEAAQQFAGKPEYQSVASDELTVLMEKYQDQPTIMFKSLKCTFIGPPQVGKTTTRMRLMEEIINISSSGHTASQSTVLQKPLTLQMYEKSDIAPIVLRSCQWKKDDLLGEMQLLLHLIQMDQDDSNEESSNQYPSIPGVQRNQDDSKEVAEPSISSQPATRQGLQEVQTMINEVVSPAIRDVQQGFEEVQTNNINVVSPARRDVQSQILNFDYVEEMMKQVLEQKGLKDIREMEETVTVYIMDFGGQPEFQEILPLVLRGPALHLVFFNASLSLKDPIHIKFRPEKGSEGSCIEYNTRYTTCEMLFQIISSLYCLSNNTLNSVTLPSGQELPHFEPTAVLIGTHIDLGTSVADVSDELEMLLKHTEFWKKDFLRTPNECSTVFYPLDNNHGTEEEIHGLQKFIRELIVQRLTSTPLPRSWLLLHIALRHRYEEDGWCTMKQCIDLAAQCNISREDVQPILHYIHNHIGNVLHYADVPGLSDIVFCEPNKLLEAINRVIILSFVGDHNHPNLAQEIRKTGEVPIKLLKQLESRCVGSSPISNKGVISLLKHFKIITELPGKDVIFVPCLLQPECSPVELASQDQVRDIDPQPLLIQFKGGYIPVGVFSGLTVELITQHEWRLPTENRFRDHLLFICASWSVEMIGHSHFLEVRIVQMDEDPDYPSAHECCKNVREILKVAVAKVLNMYEHTKETTFHLGFYCPCTSSSALNPHFCEYISDTRMMCSKTQNPHPLGNVAVWFRKPKSNPDDEDLLDPSELADLLGELQGLKDWRRLALKLRFNSDAIRKIKADNNDVVEDCILEVMETWLKKGPSSSKLALIRALEGVQEYSIAAKIRGDAPSKPSEPLTSLPDGPLNSSQHLVVIIRELQELLDWQKLGLELGLSYTTLEGIAISKNKELDDCKRAMMESWLQGKDNVQNQGGITKKSLVDALERAEFITLAHKLDPARAQSSKQS